MGIVAYGADRPGRWEEEHREVRACDWSCFEAWTTRALGYGHRPEARGPRTVFAGVHLRAEASRRVRALARAART